MSHERIAQELAKKNFGNDGLLFLHLFINGQDIIIRFDTIIFKEKNTEIIFIEIEDEHLDLKHIRSHIYDAYLCLEYFNCTGRLVFVVPDIIISMFKDVLKKAYLATISIIKKELIEKLEIEIASLSGEKHLFSL